MTNPVRPATGQVVATSWGLAVADTVVRRYPNTATRDADLVGFSSAQLLGQVCVLTDTGSLLQYVGPVMGWRPPWQLPWGYVVSAESNAGFSTDATIQAVVVTPAFNAVAGRRYRVSVGATMITGTTGATSAQMFAYLGAASVARWRVNHTSAEGSVHTGERQIAIGTSVAGQTASLRVQCSAGGALAANGDPTHWIMVEDVGPSVAAPSDLEALEALEALAVDLDAGVGE